MSEKDISDEVRGILAERTPAPEGEACPHDAYETDAAGQPVRCVDCGMAIASAASPVVPAPEGEVVCSGCEGRPVFPNIPCAVCGASPVVPVGVSREDIARAVHRGRFPEDRKPTPFEAEDASGTTYCFRIADAILAALRPTDTGWRDIATAPKDGRVVLVFSAARCVWSVVSAQWRQDWPNGGWDTISKHTTPIVPTHWMPLPPAPTDTGANHD